jgi:hypothetical protein
MRVLHQNGIFGNFSFYVGNPPIFSSAFDAKLNSLLHIFYVREQYVRVVTSRAPLTITNISYWLTEVKRSGLGLNTSKPLPIKIWTGHIGRQPCLWRPLNWEYEEDLSYMILRFSIARLCINLALEQLGDTFQLKV